MGLDYTKAANIPFNAFAPFDPRNGLFVGALEYVAIEVIVTKFLRALTGFSNKGFLELAYIHVLSLPLLGGASGWADPDSGLDAKFMTVLQDSAKGIPAVLMAQYVSDTCYVGFHLPFTKWTISDILMSAAGKALSRPLFGLIYPYIKGDLTKNIELMDELVALQRNKSNLRRN